MKQFWNNLNSYYIMQVFAYPSHTTCVAQFLPRSQVTMNSKYYCLNFAFGDNCLSWKLVSSNSKQVVQCSMCLKFHFVQLNGHKTKNEKRPQWTRKCMTRTFKMIILFNTLVVDIIKQCLGSSKNGSRVHRI